MQLRAAGGPTLASGRRVRPSLCPVGRPACRDPVTTNPLRPTRYGKDQVSQEAMRHVSATSTVRRHSPSLFNLL